MKLLQVCSGAFALLFNLLTNAQLPVCGVSSFNFLKAYSVAGDQLVGTEWAAQLYYGYPEEDKSQFRAVPGILTAREEKFFPPHGYIFDPPRYPFLQFQLQFWNTNTAPTWEQAVKIAQCDSQHWIGESRILNLNPWQTQCDCGISICPGISFYDYQPGTVTLSPILAELRIKFSLDPRGLRLGICHRDDSAVVIERSLDLKRWDPIADLITISADEFIVPLESLPKVTFYRCRRLAEP